MYVRIVTFRLHDLAPEAYVAHAEEVAPAFDGWPGLISKIWLADAGAGTYGGVYLFDSRESADASRSSATFTGMCSNPHFADLAIEEHDVLAAPTARTGGPLG